MWGFIFLSFYINPLLHFFALLQHWPTTQSLFYYLCLLPTGLHLANWWLLHPQKHFVKVPHSLLVPQPTACSPLRPGAVTPDMPSPRHPPQLSCGLSPLPSILLPKPNPTYTLQTTPLGPLSHTSFRYHLLADDFTIHISCPYFSLRITFVFTISSEHLCLD